MDDCEICIFIDTNQTLVKLINYSIFSMGSTRFFKVARANTDEGLVVVKVFVKHDPTLPLETHAERIDEIKKLLADSVNCLPFQSVVVSCILVDNLHLNVLFFY